MSTDINEATRSQGAAPEFGGSVVDHSALRVNQTGIVATVVVAFLASFVGWPGLLLLPALGIVLLVGTFNPRLALFKQLYFQVLRPRGIVQPRPVADAPAPHNFAQGLGGVFLAVSSLLIFAPLLTGDFRPSPVETVGLVLALLVAVLAFVNLAFGYCLGCQIYFRLGQAGLIRSAR